MDVLPYFCLPYWFRFCREVLKHTIHFIIVKLTGYRPGSIDRWIYYPFIHVVASIVLVACLAACVFLLGMCTCGLIELGRLILLEAATMSIPECYQDMTPDIQGDEDVNTSQLDVRLDMEVELHVEGKEVEPVMDAGAARRGTENETQLVTVFDEVTICQVSHLFKCSRLTKTWS